MTATVIVSYDGSDNDDDGLSLAGQLKSAGASLALAYVRHSHEFGERREEIAQFDAEKRLDLGATRIGDPDIPKHVLIAPSTGEGLRQFAESEGASLIVFGSEYRTNPGAPSPASRRSSCWSPGRWRSRSPPRACAPTRRPRSPRSASWPPTATTTRRSRPPQRWPPSSAQP